MNKIFATALAALVLLGCSQRIGDFTVGSTKNIDIKGTSHEVNSRKRVKGEDSVFYFILPFGSPNLEEAMDHAIEQDPRAVGLSDITLKAFTSGFVIGTIGYEIEGNPVYERKGRR